MSLGRTPLFHLVRRSLREATPTEFRLSRRDVLKAAGCGALALSGVGALGAEPSASKVAIVGAGVAGLNAALVLQDAGIATTVYEASERIGGRIYTISDALGEGLTTELGGEFIDSGHTEMLGLAERFGLELLDFEAPSETDLTETYFFGGRARTEEEIVEAFRPVAERIAADYEAVEYESYRSHNAVARRLDRTPLSVYLKQIGARGWLYDLLDVAYETEYGLATFRQSALNLVFLIGTDVEEGFKEFGESDQRYRIAGGNARVIEAIAGVLGSPIRTGAALQGIQRQHTGYRLSFRDSRGRPFYESADYVLLTVPLSLLRTIDLKQVPLNAAQRGSITNVGLGTNAKLILGFDGRPWREDGANGLFFTDQPIQSGWDSSWLQPTEAGSLTVFLGGQSGPGVSLGSAAARRDRALRDIEAMFPGSRAQANGRVVRFDWTANPWTRGSYTCYGPGDYTAYGGAFDDPAGNVYFAGEHCSLDFQGYMEGGAVTGRAAAEAMLQTILTG